MNRLDQLDRYPLDSTTEQIGETVPAAIGAEYAELKRLVKQKGLLEKQPAYYAFQIFLDLGLLAASLVFMVILDNTWLLLLNAAFLAFVFAQLGLMGHDAGHRQIFRSVRNNDVVGLGINLLLGLSRTWWIDKHNRHHSNPNQVGFDPDILIPILAFSEEQALSKRGFYGVVVRYQAFFFFPMLCLQALGVRLASAQYLMHRRAKYALTEPLLMAIHMVLYVGLSFYLLGPWQAVLFILLHQMLFGLYLASVFAPNHKGMPIVERDSQMDFLRRQVLTARNVKAHPLTDFLYGGLNYQIEHHLFPSVPRNKLKEVQKIVKAFCEERSIPFYETGVLRSYREILRYLHQVSAPLRRGNPPTHSESVLSAGGGEETR